MSLWREEGVVDPLPEGPSLHDKWCRWPQGPPCRRYSTDGTKLGAEIAHTMGTIDEGKIIQTGETKFFSDVEAEQKDWELGTEE